MNTFILILFITFLALLLLGWLVQKLLEKRRQQSWQLIAQQMGFTYSSTGFDLDSDRLDGFSLFTQRKDPEITNLMVGNIEDSQVSIFNYRYKTTNIEDPYIEEETVILFESENLALPQFLLKQETFLHKLGSFLGYQDIDFSDFSDFSADYLLQGKDEEAIRTLFTSDVIAYFSSRKGMVAEGTKQICLLYTPRQRIKPENIEAFFQDSLKLIRLLTSDTSN